MRIEVNNVEELITALKQMNPKARVWVDNLSSTVIAVRSESNWVEHDKDVNLETAIVIGGNQI